MNYVIENSILRVEISSLGGELQSVVKDGQEYLWQADPAYWDGKAPNLFPYIGRLTEGKYRMNGNIYHLPIHGFVPETNLVREGQSRDSIAFRLDADASTLACYPFDFTYRIIYALDENVLNVTYQVISHEDENMYFGIGGHPGFRVPLEEGLAFEDYYLEFEGCADGQNRIPTRIAFSPTCFLTGEDKPYPLKNGRIPLGHGLFDQDAIVLEGTAGKVRLGSDRGSRGVRVSYPDMKYIGFWHAVKQPAPYVCIEPWSSLPSRQDVVEDLAEQPGLICLAGGKTYTCRWSAEIF